jgi:hypothetical protein
MPGRAALGPRVVDARLRGHDEVVRGRAGAGLGFREAR